MINQAIILAAGFGTRLKPLTDTCPKPLLPINDKPLLAYQLQALQRAGIKRVIIHVSYLSDLIVNTIADGYSYGLDLEIIYAYSAEPLDTGGGIQLSTNFLLDQGKPFICINGKIYTDYNYQLLNNYYADDKLGHMVLVPNPRENPDGDYNIGHNKTLLKKIDQENYYYDYTYSGIAVYNSKLLIPQVQELSVNNLRNNKFSIIKIINQNLDNISASLYEGMWHGLETVEQYNELKDQRIYV